MTRLTVDTVNGPSFDSDCGGPITARNKVRGTMFSSAAVVIS